MDSHNGSKLPEMTRLCEAAATGTTRPPTATDEIFTPFTFRSLLPLCCSNTSHKPPPSSAAVDSLVHSCSRLVQLVLRRLLASPRLPPLTGEPTMPCASTHCTRDAHSALA